ncbi:MAG: hypothetical protein JWN44_4529 [Myxococcales bacterium]|nr:hypothetical protein [Myxococcales bacterium]
MRALLLILLLAGCEEEESLVPPAPQPKAKPYVTRGDVEATARKRDKCRDSCEQLSIMTAGSDADLRACRARCDVQLAPPSVEAPRTITVAPPRSIPPAVRPR